MKVDDITCYGNTCISESGVFCLKEIGGWDFELLKSILVQNKKSETAKFTEIEIDTDAFKQFRRLRESLRQ